LGAPKPRREQLRELVANGGRHAQGLDLGSALEGVGEGVPAGCTVATTGSGRSSKAPTASRNGCDASGAAAL
jgi:hypothetical protein